MQKSVHGIVKMETQFASRRHFGIGSAGEYDL